MERDTILFIAFIVFVFIGCFTIFAVVFRHSIGVLWSVVDDPGGAVDVFNRTTWISASVTGDRMVIVVHTGIVCRLCNTVVRVHTGIPHSETKTITGLFFSETITYLTDLVEYSMDSKWLKITIPVKNGEYNVTVNIVSVAGTKQYNITLDNKHIIRITSKTIADPQQLRINSINKLLLFTITTLITTIMIASFILAIPLIKYIKDHIPVPLDHPKQ